MLSSGLSLMLPLLFLTGLAVWWIAAEARHARRVEQQWGSEWAAGLIEAEDRRVELDQPSRATYPDVTGGVYDWAADQ